LEAGKLKAESSKLKAERKKGVTFESPFNKKRIEPLRREAREGFLYESGTPADRALAGVTIRTKGLCSAGNRIIIPKQLGGTYHFSGIFLPNFI
jgi:hypothetical protein